MSTARYDAITHFYLNFVQQGLDDPRSIFHLAMDAILDMLGDPAGRRVCDLACGEGYLSRALAGLGSPVTGVDISAALLEHARQRSAGLSITYVQDDAQGLTSLPDQAYHAVVSSMALMDIPDLEKTFRAVRRILRPGGSFVFAVLHPCFESPFRVPEEPIVIDAQGNFAACRVMHYMQEGYWNSGGDGMRGRVGAYHRTLSTYLNTLLACGFRLSELREPALPDREYRSLAHQRNSRVPSLLVVKGE